MLLRQTGRPHAGAGPEGAGASGRAKVQQDTAAAVMAQWPLVVAPRSLTAPSFMMESLDLLEETGPGLHRWDTRQAMPVKPAAPVLL